MRRGSPARALLGIAIVVDLAVAASAAVPRQRATDGEAELAIPDVAVAATPPAPTTPIATSGTAVESAPPSTRPTGPSSPSTTPTLTNPHPVDPPKTSTRTLLRFQVTSTAEWATVELQGVGVMVKRPARTTGDLDVAAVGSSTVAMAVRGPGTAELDVVGEVPEGAALALVTCKSPGGQVRVQAVRDTGILVTVVEVVNSRADGATSGGCENSTRTAIAREALLGPTAWPPRIDDRRLVLSFYYPWYDDQTFASGSWRNEPLPPWNTDNPAEVAQMVDLARSSGIAGFVVSYNHHPTMVRRFEYVLAAAENRSEFFVAPLLELSFLAEQRGSDTVAPADLEVWLRSVLTRSSSPAWLRVNGRPVIFLYGRDDITPATWRDVRDRLAADGLDPFVLGETVDPAFDFDGLYQYSPNVESDSTALRAWYRDGERLARLQPELEETGRSVLWAAPVSPGQDDTLLGRPPDRTLFVDRRGGARYRETWEAALETRPEWALVTSWNEFHENTEVAPSHAHGVDGLEQTSDWARLFATSG